MFPAFLLAKLYVKGSLKNTEDGFEFALKNIVDSTNLVGVGPITAGGKDFTAEAITLTVGDKTLPGAELSRENAIPVTMGIPMKIKIVGDRLAAGSQKVSVTAVSADIGKLKFEFSDTVQA
jgi:hypothetical protein